MPHHDIGSSANPMYDTEGGGNPMYDTLCTMLGAVLTLCTIPNTNPILTVPYVRYLMHDVGSSANYKVGLLTEASVDT